jgi:hypothetical protein
MLTSCKNVNTPEIIHAVEQEQGASAGPPRTTRMWVHDMHKPQSTIDLALPVEHDYNFLRTYCQASETLNAGSINYSMDSNANLVCVAHCLYEQENQEGYERLLGLCHLKNTKTAILADRHSGTHSRFLFSTSSYYGHVVILPSLMFAHFGAVV